MHSLPSRVALIVLVVALGISTATTARAAEDAATAAREHYQKGTAYYDLGKYTEAIKEFEAAYEIKNDPALLYNLAQSHRLAGNAEQALHFYRTYLRRVPKASNRVEIEGRIAALEQQVAQKNAPPGTTPPTVIPPPGTTTPPPPEATPPGGTGTTPPGVTTTPVTPVTPVTPPSTSPPPPGVTPPGTAGTLTAQAPPPSAAVERARRMKLIGTVTAAGGGVLILVGMIEGARAVSAANQINNAARDGKAYDPAVEARGLNAQHAEAITLILGFLAAGAGAGLYYYGWRSERAAVSVTPVASAHGAGATLGVTF